MRRRDLLAGAAASAVAGPVLARVQAAGQAVGPAELITYQSGGKPVRAAVYRPASGQANGAGVVLLHGAGGVWPPLLRMAEEFAGRGYLAIAPVYYDVAPDDGVRPERVMNAWRGAASDAVDWLIDQGVDRRRTGTLGYSLGAYVSVDGALGRSRAAAAVSIVGGWDVYVPRRPARRIPVLLIYGENDGHVSPASTRRWAQFLDEAEVPVRTWVVRGAGHVFDPVQLGEAFDRSLAFFDEALGVERPA